MAEAFPSWYYSLHSRLEELAERLSRELTGWRETGTVVRPEDFGDTSGKATDAIQKAIDTVNAAGGGTVLLSGREYVTGSIVMKSNVRLRLSEGCRLSASTDLNDYPEHICRRVTVQDTHMGMNQALIFAEGAENICLCGPGTVDGNGTRDCFPGDETQHGTPGRPFLIRFVDCVNVHVHHITLKNAACWMENYFNCERLLLEHITVRSQVNWNNDGIDIDGCRDVIVRHCDVKSGDDALCFKAASERPTERVLVEHCSLFSSCNALKVGTDTQSDFRNILVRSCQIGGVSEDPGGIKHPFSDSAVSLEAVDGGTVEDFLVTNCRIERAWSPFFMRLEDRGRVREGLPRPGIGTLRHVVLEHISGCDCGPRGSYFLSVPEKPISGIILNDIRITQAPSKRPVRTEEDFGEMRGVYPDAHMIDSVGDAPAYALWAVNTSGLILNEYHIIPEGEDPRPEFLFSGVREEKADQ